MMHHILSFFIPQACIACRSLLDFSEESSVCPSCTKELKPLSSSICEQCGDPFPHEEVASHLCGECLTNPPPFEWARSVFELEPKLAQMIHAAKYKGDTPSLQWLGKQIEKEWPRYKKKIVLDWIVPVPLHPFRLLKRGFNQSLLIALSFSKRIQVPLEFKNLKRKMHEKSQVSRTREERLQQIRGSFAVKNSAVFKNKKILLIDDVYTTGATLRECAKVLKKCGATVYALTLARTLLLR